MPQAVTAITRSVGPGRGSGTFSIVNGRPGASNNAAFMSRFRRRERATSSCRTVLSDQFDPIAERIVDPPRRARRFRVDVRAAPAGPRNGRRGALYSPRRTASRRRGASERRRRLRTMHRPGRAAPPAFRVRACRERPRRTLAPRLLLRPASRAVRGRKIETDPSSQDIATEPLRSSRAAHAAQVRDIRRRTITTLFYAERSLLISSGQFLHPPPLSKGRVADVRR
jgi:hypothetical protein